MTPEEQSASIASSWRRAHLLSRCVGAWRRAVAFSQAEGKKEIKQALQARVLERLRRFAKRQGMRDALVLQELAASHWCSRRCYRLLGLLLARSRRARTLRTYADRVSMRRGMRSLMRWALYKRELKRVSPTLGNRSGAVWSGMLLCVRRWRRRVALERDLRQRLEENTVTCGILRLRHSFCKYFMLIGFDSLS